MMSLKLYQYITAEAKIKKGSASSNNTGNIELNLTELL